MVSDANAEAQKAVAAEWTRLRENTASDESRAFGWAAVKRDIIRRQRDHEDVKAFLGMLFCINVEKTASSRMGTKTNDTREESVSKAMMYGMSDMKSLCSRNRVPLLPRCNDQNSSIITEWYRITDLSKVTPFRHTPRLP